MRNLTTSGAAVSGALDKSRSANNGAMAPCHATICIGQYRSMVRSKLNVRRRTSKIEELKSLIRAQGLLQNLIGYKQLVDGVETGVIEIVAGGRRLTAVGELIAEGDLPEDYGITYLLVSESEAIEISLIENSGREDMHPADVFDAMLELSKHGRSIDDIALIFGLDVLAVRRRLKLANVSPKLLNLYRNELASFDQMQALAISDDHEAQEHAWESLPEHGRYPHSLRRLLTANLLNIRTDRLVRYVGAAAFERAGGVICRDLFSTSNDGYIADIGLLEKLATDKLEVHRKKLLKEGFAWVDILPRADHADISAYAKVRTELAQFTSEQSLQALELERQIEELEARFALLSGCGEEESDLVAAELGNLKSARRNLESCRIRVQVHEDKLLAGAVVAVNEQGGLVIFRDLIRPADKCRMVVRSDGSNSQAKKAKAIHSERLTHELTSQRTVAMQAEMMNQSEIALVYLTYTLMQEVFSHGVGSTLASVSIRRPVLADAALKSAAASELARRREELLAQLPDDHVGGGWLEWLARSPTSVVLNVLAFCVACTIDATQRNESDNPMFATLARGLRLDMAKWWKPTAEGYFNHVSKERILSVVTDSLSIGAAVPLSKLKKAAAADAAERALSDSGWLPEVLRA